MISDVITLPSELTLAVSRVDSQGPAALLIHGWTCRKSDWDSTIDALKDEFRLTAIDLPGHGESRNQSVDDWSVSGLARVVVDAATQRTWSWSDTPWAVPLPWRLHGSWTI